MGMARAFFALRSIVMDMAVVRDLNRQLGMPRSLGGRQRDWVVGGRAADGRQQQAERHRERDDEAKS